MAKPELGIKRVCPETGRKFYDLNKDPIVSPYTGKTYPISFFEVPALVAVAEKVKDKSNDDDDDDDDVADTETDSADVEIVSLEEADGEKSSKKGKSEDLPDIDDDVEIEEDDDDDAFLADDDDDDDDDVSDIIGVNDDDDDQ